MRTPILSTLALSTLLLACGKASGPDETRRESPHINAPILDNSRSNAWYQQADKDLQKSLQVHGQPGKAKNVILFVGDGMGISTLTAARIFEGQQRGQSGEENSLSFERFPYSGLIKTYNVDAQTPDSAGTMTAMVTGVKTDAGVLSVDEGASRGNCQSQQGRELSSFLELAELTGKSTGIVTTARITHATPAAAYAKAVERNWEDDSKMPAEAVEHGCLDIARQLIDFEDLFTQRYPGAHSDGIEVIMGGGRRSFLPADAAFNSSDAISEIEGERRDGYNLVALWQERHSRGRYVMDSEGFRAIDIESTERLLGLFNESHMRFEADRSNDRAGEPSLLEMTEKAIALLSKNPQGFFLMVEAGRIDHAHHAGNAFNALNDTLALSDAVRRATEMTDAKDTLIIVTADHSHVFTMAGYPKRGNPILGKVVGIGESQPSLAADGKPYATLGYANGPGFKDGGSETNPEMAEPGIHQGRADLQNVDTAAPGFHQEALVPLYSETHGGEDVAIFASGPGAALVSGSHEQNRIFHIMKAAADIAL